MKTASFRASIVPVLMLALSVAGAKEPDHHTLWKVTSGNATVYLMGSVHLLHKEQYPLAHELEDAYRESDSVLFEAPLDEDAQASAAGFMARRSMLGDSLTLQDVVSPDTYAAVKEQCASSGISLALLHRLKPWAVALTVLTVELQRMGLQPQYGLDRYFHTRALRDGKGIGAFETIEFQLGLLDGMDRSLQDRFLRQTVSDVATMKSDLAMLIDAWSRGRTRVLDSMLVQGTREFPALYDRIVVDRNRAWLPRVVSYLKGTHTILVVVGAGHLVGRDGLVALLRRNGYAVDQL